MLGDAVAPVRKSHLREGKEPFMGRGRAIHGKEKSLSLFARRGAVYGQNKTLIDERAVYNHV